MFSVRRPPTEAIRAFLAAQAKLDLTYTAVGATGGEPPAGYVVDHVRVRLGRGEAVFTRAKAALKRWAQFDLGWVEAWSPETPIRTGEVVAILSRQFGLWWLSACRLVTVVDEAAPVARFGFAYGTLPDHAGSGEERFLVEWDRESDEVWYDIRAFSRPRWLVSRLGYPYMRRLQRRFGRDSTAAMQRAVSGEA
jgi:uncharacterized protein (UPF0548 family)